jgi:rfaE bifunctional protein kinase chain/domain/rfaE bifunctional protein nucleotidyltransferase chain/domain
MSRHDKITSVQELAGVMAALRADGSRKAVVQCHGVFDLLHIGHIRHFEQAKSLGDVLVVTITPDRYVNKGAHRPAFPEDLRAEAIAALDCVDYVAVNEWPTAVECIKLIQPDVYAKGQDYKDASQDVTGKIGDEENAVAASGGRLAFTEDIVFSSTSLINQFMPAFSPEVSAYLDDFSQRHSVEKVQSYLHTAQTLKVLVVGETIIDEYHYCELMGKSGKEPILAAKYTSSDKFAGGILAVANHVSNLCDEVSIATMLGAEQTQEEWVREHTKANFDLILKKEHSPTITKRRFVDRHLLGKIFEIYEMNDDPMSPGQDKEFCTRLDEIITGFDVVMVVDYGHAMLTPDAVSILSSKAKFLAVNTQANAGNRGFNTISKYPRADYICLAEPEIALEERNRQRDLKEMIRSVSDKLNCGKVNVTRGKDGSLSYDVETGFEATPAIASKVVDRVGAGDTVLSVTSLYAAQNAPMDIIGFIGNVAGAEAVATMGHSESVARASLHKHVESLLK